MKAVGWPLVLVPLLFVSPVHAIKETKMVPADDGTLLATDIYRANDTPKPVELMRGGNARAGMAGTNWGTNAETTGDRVLIVQDIRGTGDSEGSNLLFSADGDDGRALLGWIAKQPWSIGRVAMLGWSNAGITAYVMAPGADASLVAFNPNYATGDLLHFGVYQGGAWHADVGDALDLPATLTSSWQSYRANPSWAKFLVDDAQAAAVDAVGLHRGGFFDVFVQGNIDSFAKIQAHGGPHAKGRQKLLMGPWAHGGTSNQVGELTFPASANLSASPYPDLVNAWTSGWLTNDWAAWNAAKAVHLYVMGDPTAPTGNKWEAYDAWPPPAMPMSFYLSNGGTFVDKPASPAEASFKSDPANPCPTRGGTNNLLSQTELGPYDQRLVVESRKDVLLFTSDPLPVAAESIGRIHADLWIETDVPDVDIVLRLTDVYPDGRSMLMAQGIQRARYRNGACPALLTPGEPTRVQVDMLSTAVALAAGHKFRLIVSASAAPLYAVNPQNGDEYVDQNPSQVATIKLLFGGDKASALILPVASINGKPTPGDASWDGIPDTPCAGGSAGAGAGGSGGSSGGAPASSGGSDTGGASSGGASAQGKGGSGPASEAAPDDSTGCGCRTAQRASAGPYAVALLFALFGMRLRRRRCRLLARHHRTEAKTMM